MQTKKQWSIKWEREGTARPLTISGGDTEFDSEMVTHTHFSSLDSTLYCNIEDISIKG